MTTIEIVQLVIAILSIPVLVSVIGWLNPVFIARHTLVRDLNIADKLPEGEERDIWLKAAEDRARELRQTKISPFREGLTLALIMSTMGVPILFLFYWNRGTSEETLNLFGAEITYSPFTVSLVVVSVAIFATFLIPFLMPRKLLKPKEPKPKD